jgi:hypothetical protein
VNIETLYAIPVAISYAFVFFFALIPLFVWMQLRQIIKLLREIRDSNDRIADNTTPSGSRPHADSSVKYSMPK